MVEHGSMSAFLDPHVDECPLPWRTDFPATKEFYGEFSKGLWVLKFGAVTTVITSGSNRLQGRRCCRLLWKCWELLFLRGGCAKLLGEGQSPLWLLHRTFLPVLARTARLQAIYPEAFSENYCVLINHIKEDCGLWILSHFKLLFQSLLQGTFEKWFPPLMMA